MPNQRDTPQRSLIASLGAAVAPKLGARSSAAVLVFAKPLGLQSRTLSALVREAERRLDGHVDHLDDSGDTHLCRYILSRADLTADQRARLLSALGRAELKRGRADDAFAHLAEANTLRPSRQRLVMLLRSAAEAGNPDSFFAAYSADLRDHLPASELGDLFGKLAQQCCDVEDWRGAAEAYQLAYRVDPENKSWNRQFLHMRKLAPDWGFYARDPDLAWRLDDYADELDHGLVAPMRQPVFGWLPRSAADTQVLFKVNGTVIADTRATTAVTLPDGRPYLQFSRNLKHLWSWVGAGDTLVIESGGKPLTIINRGDSYTFRRDGKHAGELLSRLANGFVFDKYGHFNPSIQNDSAWQDRMFDLYGELRDDLQEIGITLFPFYGTLLGAVRDHAFIGHDNDFDTVYISDHASPERVREQFKDICAYLLSRGFELYVKKTHTWVMVPGTTHKIDIFFSWFNRDGYFDVSYGYHGDPVQESDEFREFREEKLGDRVIPAPHNAEQIMAQLYGPGWRVPDPGFAHRAPTRKMDTRYHLSTLDVTELHWNQFYRDHEPDRASPFAEFVAGRFASPGTLIEFGCGTGRDGIYLANRGWTTLCCDRSPEAIARATAVLDASGGLPARFESVDVSSADDVKQFLHRHAEIIEGADPLVVYLRFFLHAIDEPAQETLLKTITQSVTGEFVLCAEFRTIEDRHLAKHHGAHYRRYIDPHELADELREQWGFHIEHLEAGQGLSPYDGEDPHLARVMAVRHSPATPG